MSKHIPNLLGWLRIALVAPVMVLIQSGEKHQTLAFVLFSLAVGTDFLDGKIARRWKVTSSSGAVLDTVADKLLTVGALMALLQVDRVWLWAAFIITAREFAVMGLRSFAGLNGVWIAPSWSGKWKAAFQFFAIAAAIVRGNTQMGVLFFDEWLMLVATGMTVYSGVTYFVRYRLS